MLISYNWLKEYLDINISADDLAEKIERSSVEVDSVITRSKGLKKIIVGQIMSFEKHPDSDHLNICQVDTGEDELEQIVCGAPNVEVGAKVIVASPGARIADNVKIKKAKMRGIESRGMLCALDEIGFPKDVVPKEWSDGIYFLPEDAVVGNDVYEYIGMNDSLIDLDVTPNRGDMLSIRGTLFDLAAIYNKNFELETNEVKNYLNDNISDLINLNVDETLSSNYNLRIIKNVKVEASPLWLQIRLWNAGIKPINNIVDVTNYIMIKLGQPLHAYDLDKINQNDISVRRAKNGETITTLDDVERILNETDVVISDSKSPIALAGLMGGKDTEVDDNTTNILLEGANFNSVNTRKMAQKQNLHTDASQRFERKIDDSNIVNSIEDATGLIEMIANGEATKDILTKTVNKSKNKIINITSSRINHVLGTDFDNNTIIDIFNRLNFEVEIENDSIKVTIPSRRNDISMDADLIEEIARIYGYDNIGSTLPTTKMTQGKLSKKQKLIRNSRKSMEEYGLTHAISYSLTSEEKSSQFSTNDQESVQLKFPMSMDHSNLRMNLLSGLLDDVAYNQARNVKNVALYEQGRIFIPNDNDVRPTEIEHLAGVISGSLVENNWKQKSKKVDFYDIKGILNEFLKNLSFVDEITYVATDKYSNMHPGRTADILIGDTKIGFIGQVHPKLVQKYKIDEVYGFEINLDIINDLPKKEQLYNQISQYPSIKRDIALLLNDDITHADVYNLIKKRGGAYLTKIDLFDIYEGENIPEGKKSMAYSLIFQDKNGTLTDEDVNKSMEKIQNNLEKEFDLEIR
ncbi:phenylalanine--tRNA ligase subunit beta [Lactobacillus sp. S2-2]|uniref:phenylalanine--tRNA ligase subunit beta n=1 Tax=Lactobacillus sp. S2-2 TaxID=2692917 RepID=UPI001F01B679|nr:phenylalanine--tRNA ligase subunit beta [Lactobacillus sp. S2-2]MCF6515131.1 phenylalanine--tRNA ligase subunit beta [Lactobacillus sp. S2-2]